jgi:hypothetical protein
LLTKQIDHILGAPSSDAAARPGAGSGDLYRLA